MDGINGRHSPPFRFPCRKNKLPIQGMREHVGTERTAYALAINERSRGLEDEIEAPSPRRNQNL
jgi:hypothetical protein